MLSSIAILAGAVLLGLGTPRAIGSFVMFPSAPVLEKIQHREDVTVGELRALVASQQRGLAWFETGRMWTDLGLAQLMLSERTTKDAAAADLLSGAAIVSLRQGLALAPANPYAWIRLALAEETVSGPSKNIARMLATSMATGPAEQTIVLLRLEAILRNWNYFERNDRRLVFGQIRYLWRDSSEGSKWHRRNVDRNRGELVRLARRTGGLGLVRAALLRTPDALSDFEALLKKTAS